MKKGRFTKDGKRTKKEKILITILISAIVVLALGLGYDMYTSFKTRAEARIEIGSLNSNVIALNQEKDQLILERDALNQTVISLNQQKTQLIADKNELTTDKDDLTSQLATLQENYDALSLELQGVEDDLYACQNP